MRKFIGIRNKDVNEIIFSMFTVDGDIVKWFKAFTGLHVVGDRTGCKAADERVK